MGGKEKSLIKVLLSLLILLLFVWGVGKSAFFPSFRLLQDTQWDTSLFVSAFSEKLCSFLWMIPIGLGFLGWTGWFKKFLFPKFEKNTARLLGVALCLSFFSLYVFGLAINEILYWPLIAFFFILPILTGWEEWKALSFAGWGLGKNMRTFGLFIPLFLWSFEYLS